MESGFRMQFPVSPFPPENQDRWEILLNTAKAAVAVGGGDSVTGVGIPNVNPKAIKNIQSQQEGQRDCGVIESQNGLAWKAP